MDKYISEITAENPIVYIREPDSTARGALHEDMKNYPKHILRSKYEPNDRDVRCDNCKGWTPTEHSLSACCDNCYTLRVKCSESHSHCNGEDDRGYIWYHPDDSWDRTDYTGLAKFRPRLWVPTGQMIVMRTGTSYKHLNTRTSSYRKRGPARSI